MGTFCGSPPLPSEKVTTISANVLLVAQASLSNAAAGEMTRLLLATKTRVAAILPEAGQLAAPSTDKDELLPAHPGTVAFLNGEQSNALDESMNWILLASMLTGFLGSLAAWLNRVRNKRRADEVKCRLRRLRVLQVQASSIAPDKIDVTEKEVDAISQCLRQKFAERALAGGFQDAEARTADIAALIEERRASLALDAGLVDAGAFSPVKPSRWKSNRTFSVCPTASPAAWSRSTEPRSPPTPHNPVLERAGIGASRDAFASLIWVRCMTRRAAGSNGSRRCRTERLFHMSTSPTRHSWHMTNRG